MAWNDGKVELTEKQKEMAQIAGIPADRPGLGDEYPKAVYRKGKGEQLYGEPFKTAGLALDVATVSNAEEEAEAIELGWYLSPDLEAEQKRKDAMAEKDAEIEALRSQLAEAGKNRGGRPPRVPEPSPAEPEQPDLTPAEEALPTA
jgi:hypothetical protein